MRQDEGRHVFVRADLDYEQAQKWIRDQKGKYFGPDDYYVAKKGRK